MIFAEGLVVNLMLAAPKDVEYWLIGWNFEYVINAIPLVSKEEALKFLPGGLRLLGKYFSSDVARDFQSLSLSLSLNQSLFIVRTESKLQCYYIDAISQTQKDLGVKPPPSYYTLYSKTSIPIFSLPNPDCWFLDQPVLYRINDQLYSITESGSWSSLGFKSKSLISVEILFELTTETEDFAPCVEIQPANPSFTLHLNWCTSVLESTNFNEALNIHSQRLKDLISSIIPSLSFSPLTHASSYCFLNSYIQHPIIMTYFYTEWNEDSKPLEDQRKKAHELFRLPIDWPLLRSVCNIREPEGLRDIHLPLMEIKPSDVGVKTCVKGHYAYFHYSQDGFDDKGWGCAYRSLQTLISWLREQYFFHSEIPSHYQIQKLLVEAGDKPKEFIGSKEWIGAYEVMLIIDTYCKISCKIINLSSGAEFINKGRELAQHFSCEGSPVMIGGGVLAYTLLGVDFNEDTGACKYLILDPHYVGPDNVSTILQKGWCAWKGPEIFKPDTFYNLCLPQRPRYI